MMDARAIENAVKRGVLAALKEWFDLPTPLDAPNNLQSVAEWRRFAKKVNLRRAA